MKIGVVVPRFAITGVPLAQIRFATAWARRGHDVTLIIGHVESGYELPPVADVKVEVWNRFKVRGMFWPMSRYLRFQKPDVIFSAEDHLNTIVLAAAIFTGSKTKISGSSRVTPFDTYSNRVLSKRWILKQFAKAVMWRADALTCVSMDMVEQYRRVFASPKHVCAYNIVDDAASRQKMARRSDHPWLANKDKPVLVSAGRLATWKGFADLIEAMTHIDADRRPRLLILGDGPLRGQLQDQIDASGLGDWVQLVGYVDNPLSYFSAADVFVLSSLVEGMPNVLVEAMMCGCTPVATDCPTGPRELLKGGKFGYLVPVQNPVAMAAAIQQALAQPIARDVLAEAVRPFEENTVLDEHMRMLNL